MGAMGETTYWLRSDVRVAGREEGLLGLAQEGRGRNGLSQRLDSDDGQIAGDDGVNHFEGFGV